MWNVFIYTLDFVSFVNAELITFVSQKQFQTKKISLNILWQIKVTIRMSL